MKNLLAQGDIVRKIPNACGMLVFMLSVPLVQCTRKNVLLVVLLVLLAR